MTNAQIITEAMILNNISDERTVDTFAGWKRHGKCVKKGEKAVFTTSIWKPSNRKKNEEAENSDDENNSYRGMYLVKASFFTDLQVEDLKEGKDND